MPGIEASASERLAALAARAGLELSRPQLGSPLGFRTRARLAVRGRAASPKVGIFQTGTHKIADIPRCGIHHPAVNEVARELRAAVRAAGVEPYADRPHRGVLRYLQVAVERASGRAQVVLVGNCETPEPLAPVFAALERALGERLQGLFWNGNTEPGNAILGPRWERIAGEEVLRETVGGVDVFHPPGAFGQSHPELFESLALRARAAVPEGARVLELYAGAGAIGLGLLERAASVELNELSSHGLRGLELGIGARPGRGARARFDRGRRCDTAREPGRARRRRDRRSAPPRSRPRRARRARRRAARDLRLRQLRPRLVPRRRRGAARARAASRCAQLETFALFPYTPHVETLAVFAGGRA